MTNITAASVAFFALGANVIALALLFLFNPTNRAARWFIGWTLAWIVVLLAQGMMLLPDSSPLWIVAARAGKSWQRKSSERYDVLKPFFDPIVRSVSEPTLELNLAGLSPNTTYFIQVDGWNGATGMGALEITS